jgi:hypothetical protein
MIDNRDSSELLSWYDLITQHNYFIHNNTTYIQQEGLAMGAPSSALISEIFLQYIEFTYLKSIVSKHHITGYFWYVDILITFDSTKTELQTILQVFNNIHPKLNFTAELEYNNCLHYLDISINRPPTNFTIQIYRKPTFSDTIIPIDSNHPPQHEYAAVRFLHNRLHNYDLDIIAFSKELNSIHNILYNNCFPIKPYKHKQKHCTHTDIHTYTQNQKQKWVTFTYTGKETKYITQILKNTNIKVSFKTKKLPENPLKP